MNINKSLAAVVALLLPGIAAAAEDSVTRYRLAADPGNSSSCKELDPALALQHTVTVRNGDVEITSAGGVEGRMRELRAGVYMEAFELSGLRLDVIADLSSAPKTLTVSDRLFGCKWQANPEQ
jgi:hypothetical protein